MSVANRRGGLALFYSYSRADETLRIGLEKHLATLKRQQLLRTWSFRDIDAGDDWRQRIDVQLETAHIILLLVSADFIASDYCWKVEMKRAIERAKQKAAVVMPVILRPCDWKKAPFAHLQALPEDAKPVTSWGSRDRAWANVAEGIRRRVESRAVLKKDVQAASIAYAKSLSLRKRRVDRTLGAGARTVRRAARAVFEHLGNLVADITSRGASLPLVYHRGGDFCSVGLADIRLYVDVNCHEPITTSTIQYWLCDDDKNEGALRGPPPRYRLRLSIADDGGIGWLAHNDRWSSFREEKFLSHAEVADAAIMHLLQEYDQRERRRM